MYKCVIPKGEWTCVADGELKEKQTHDDVRKTFSRCVETILQEYLQQAVMHADERSAERILTQRHANYAARKVNELHIDRKK